MSEALWHDAFYRFVKIDEPEVLVQQLATLCQELGLLGSILVAQEGINGMLAGNEGQLAEIHHFFAGDERFQDLFYKRTFCSAMPFKRLKVKLKEEIVPLGIAGVDASKTGINVSPEDWRKLICQEDIILIDNRNSFEYAYGHFRGARDPGVTNFRDFAAYVEENKATWQGKKVAMYCTGGIRCEKSSAWLLDLGLEVYQLKGGILNYFKEIPDAQNDFEGACFVFDQRVALDTKLAETGLERA